MELRQGINRLCPRHQTTPELRTALQLTRLRLPFATYNVGG